MRLAIILVLGSSLCFSASLTSFPDTYDKEIRKAVRVYWPDRPLWKEYKAQLYQESRLDPDAVSPVGAKGLAQFMPGTWSDMRRLMRLDRYASPFDPKVAIDAGAFYMHKLRRGWSSPRPDDDRQKLAQASYNAGFKRVLKAQKLCGMPTGYAPIIACLPCVTGRHSLETIDYVHKIEKWYLMMEVMK